MRCVGRRAGPHPGELFVGARFSPPFHTPRASCHEFPYRALVQDASVACPRPSSSRPLAVWHGAGATGAPSSSLFVDASCARWNAAGVLLIEPAQMDGWAQRPSSRCISVGVRWLASALFCAALRCPQRPACAWAPEEAEQYSPPPSPSELSRLSVSIAPPRRPWPTSPTIASASDRPGPSPAPSARSRNRPRCPPRASSPAYGRPPPRYGRPSPPRVGRARA